MQTRRGLRLFGGWRAILNTNELVGKATAIQLRSFKAPHMRTFHLTWLAFFLCFFGWFGIAPLLPEVREDLGLTTQQVLTSLIASVFITIFARIAIGWILDRVGPRRTYTALLLLGSIPVMLIGLSQNFETLLIFRLLIGVIGAGFVITQYHTSIMFAPNVVGTANATTAGWGNLGGGVTQLVMPLVMTGVLFFVANEELGWRIAMVVPGAALFLMGIVYYKFTQDAPEGDFKDLRAQGRVTRQNEPGAFGRAARDPRVWLLFVIYGACFGIELTINGMASLYFHDRFGLSTVLAGTIASLFGLMNIFARTLGGWFSDKFGFNFGLRGRVLFMGAVLGLEGLALIAFSRMDALIAAIPMLIVFSIFVQMSEGATYGVVPFVNKKALGAVAGIVGAGGNAGAVAAGFLLRADGVTMEQALLYLGIVVVCVSPIALLVRFSKRAEADERERLEAAVAERDGLAAAVPVVSASGD